MATLALGAMFMAQLSPLWAQEPSTSDSESATRLEPMAEWAERAQESAENSAWTEALVDWGREPEVLSAETVSLMELAALPGMDEFIASNLWHFLARNGPPAHPQELKAVPGLDSAHIFTLAHRFKFEPRRGPKARNRTEHKLQMGLEYSSTQARDLREEMPGAPVWSTRFRYEWKRNNLWRAALLLDSDPGERFAVGTIANGPLLFDHVSGFLEWTPRRPAHKLIPTRLILGDFRFESGQGLAMWSLPGFNPGSGALLRHPRLGTAYAGGDEDYGLRGISSEWRLGKLRLAAYASINARDVRLEDGIPMALRSGGIHRSTNEILGRSALRSSLSGWAAVYSKERYRLGLGTHHQKVYAAEAFRASGFEGQSEHLIQVDVLVPLSEAKAYAEGVYSVNSKGLAFCTGVDWSLPGEVFTAIRLEKRDLEFRSAASFDLRDFDLKSLESLQWNTDFPLGNRWRARLGVIGSREFELKSGEQLESGLLTGLDYRINGIHSLRLSGNARKTVLETSGARFEERQDRSRWGWSAEWKTQPNRRFSASLRHLRNFSERTPFEVEYPRSRGIAWMLSVKAVRDLTEEEEVSGLGWSFTTQLGWIDSEGWDNRFYLYEAGPIGSFSIPAYSGKALFINTLIRVRTSRNQSFWLRLSRRERIERAELDALNPWYVQLQWDARW